MVKEKASSMVKNVSAGSRDPAAAALRAVNELWLLGQPGYKAKSRSSQSSVASSSVVVRKMELSLFLNSLLEFYLSFGSEFLYNNLNPISILVLWFFLLFIFFVGIPYFRENEQTHKHRVRAKRRRKGGTRRGSRYHQSKDDDREQISFLKSSIFLLPITCSTLGQNYNITRCRRLLCPDPSCEVCNNAAAEINQMLFSEALEKSTSSVSSVASSASETAPVTEPSFNQSSVFSAVPLGELLPTPLPEPSPQPPSVLSSNPMTTLGNFLSPLPLGQTPEPMHHSSPQPKDLFSSTLTHYDLHQGFLPLHSTKTSFWADPEAKLIDPRHLLFLSPDEHDSTQEDIYPKTWKGNLKEKLTQLFWGLPSLHSESLSSAVNASGDYSIFFNSISNSFTDQESPGLSYFQPPFLAEVQPQPLSQTLPCLKPEYFHLTQIQTQAHLQTPLPILPSSPITQKKACEMSVHIPNYASECHTSSETEHLECNVLLKEQESWWGLTSVVQSSKAPVTNSIDPVEFPLSSEFRDQFEHHLRKRLIQHHQGQPCMLHGPLSLMRPLSNCSGILESKSSSGLSWISVDKDQSSENPNVGLRQPGSFYERSLEMFQLEENKGKDEGPGQENDPKAHLLSDSKTSSHKDVGSGSEVMSLSRENSMFSEHSVSQRQLENVQKVHFLRKKFEKIGEGQLPGTVHSSQHSIKQNPVKSHTKLEKRSLPSSVGGDYCLSTSQELPSLECGAQQMRKPHITKCQMGMLSAVPTKVLQSKEHFKPKDTASHSSINPNSSSSTKLISEANTKSGAFMPLRGSSESLHLDKVETGNSADDLNFPLPAISLMDKKGHSPAEIQRTLSEEIQKFFKIKLPVTNTINEGKSQIHPLIANIQPPKLPARQEGTPQETKNNSVNSDRVEIQQGANREKSEPASRPSMCREIVRAEGLKALQPQTSGVLTTRKPGISQRIDKETIVTTENPSVQDPNLSELKMQIMTALKLKLETKYSESESQPTDVSYDSDSLTCRGSLTPDQGVSSGDEEVPQLLHVQLEDSGVSMEKQQEPWLPRQALRSCQDQNSPPAVNNDIVSPPPEPTGPKSVELGAGDAQLTISQPEEKIFLSQEAILEDILRNRSSQALSQKGQATSLVGKEDTHFLGKIKNFFQRYQPGIKQKMQEALQEKGIIPLSSTQSRGPVKSRAAFTGPAHDMSDMGKSPEEKLGRRPAVVTTCPQEPLPSTAQSGKPVQKGAVQAQAEPVQRRPFLRRAPPYDVTNAVSGRHTAILAGQGSSNTRHTTNEHRPPQNVVLSKGQQICQKHPQSVPLRGTLPHPSPNCRPQIAKGPPAVLTTAGGTAFREQPPRFRHTMLLQNFQGETFPTPK
ncbi:spermatogenesis-associated protein 31D1-like [Myotis yumanensis]|uniref:spermatogenesis-associated protein 31D1-like n=1 Tax=Myotis yumanensis TaxID=159337 RepID=UPI0038D4364F